MQTVEQVKPADSRGHRHNGAGPPEHRKRSRGPARLVLPLVVAIACLAWIGVGVHGVVSYGEAYWKYRGFSPPHDRAGVSPGRVTTVRFHSAALGRERTFLVYLPPGYAAERAAGRRFPVLYLLHGSPGGPSLFVDAGNMGVDVDALLARRAIRPFLIAMPNGSDGTFTRDTEWANTPHGRYESLVLEIVHQMDARFPTLAKRRFRAIGGLSEGAYGAINIALHHPRTFGAAESWSGYFLQRRTGPFRHASLAAIAANSPISYVGSLAPQLRRYPLRALIYVGKRDHAAAADAGFAFAFRRAGGQVAFRLMGGRHDWQLWRAMMPRALRYADRAFWPHATRAPGAVPPLRPPARLVTS
jgi:enterochelin esterase-like enzyme